MASEWTQLLAYQLYPLPDLQRRTASLSKAAATEADANEARFPPKTKTTTPRRPRKRKACSAFASSQGCPQGEICSHGESFKDTRKKDARSLQTEDAPDEPANDDDQNVKKYENEDDDEPEPDVDEQDDDKTDLNPDDNDYELVDAKEYVVEPVEANAMGKGGKGKGKDKGQRGSGKGGERKKKPSSRGRTVSDPKKVTEKTIDSKQTSGFHHDGVTTWSECKHADVLGGKT
eukprot:2866260-Amphidinium_carterae.1